MANRFWVGNGGTWDNEDTTHWSATSGGSGGASVPGPIDDIFFNSSSFSFITESILFQKSEFINSSIFNLASLFNLRLLSC